MAFYLVKPYLIQGGKANFAGWDFVFLEHGSRYWSENWHRWSSGLILWCTKTLNIDSASVSAMQWQSLCSFQLLVHENSYILYVHESDNFYLSEIYGMYYCLIMLLLVLRYIKRQRHNFEKTGKFFDLLDKSKLV